MVAEIVAVEPSGAISVAETCAVRALMIVEDEIESDETFGEATVSFRVLAVLPEVAVMVTELLVETALVVMAKVTEVLPEPTVTELGAVATDVSELSSVMTWPPDGALEPRRTVPVDLDPPVTVEGLTVTDESEVAVAGKTGMSDRMMAMTTASRFMQNPSE
jgi:hypothetical protein